MDLGHVSPPIPHQPATYGADSGAVGGFDRPHIGWYSGMDLMSGKEITEVPFPAAFFLEMYFESKAGVSVRNTRVFSGHAP